MVSSANLHILFLKSKSSYILLSVMLILPLVYLLFFTPNSQAILSLSSLRIEWGTIIEIGPCMIVCSLINALHSCHLRNSQYCLFNLLRLDQQSPFVPHVAICCFCLQDCIPFLFSCVSVSYFIMPFCLCLFRLCIIRTPHCLCVFMVLCTIRKGFNRNHLSG